jgi:hypothetical protein
MADIVNFKTTSMATNGTTLAHSFSWESSTGSLGDLDGVKTREHVSWDAPPAEFKMEGEYSSAGEHHGQAFGEAKNGGGNDNHSIIPIPPATKGYGDIDAGSESGTWMMRQEWEHDGGNGNWQPIEGATYEITRWYERQGNDLVAYCAKRGTGSDSSMHRAMYHWPGYFTG